MRSAPVDSRPRSRVSVRSAKKKAVASLASSGIPRARRYSKTIVEVAPKSGRMSHQGARALAGRGRVVIDHDVDAVPGRQRVVAGLRLAVDERDEVERVGVDLLDGRERHPQRVDHGAVLGAADDPAVPQRHRGAELVLEQVPEAQRRRQRVGIGVVVHVDERALAARPGPPARG